MKKPRKKNNNLKRARAGVKGLIIEWEDTDPISHHRDGLSNKKVTHKNPVFKMCAHKVMQDFQEFITHKQAFLWQLNITVVFDYPNGQTQLETRELEAFSQLSNINEHSLEAIKDAQRHGNMKYYRTTRFLIECLDTADKKTKP